MKKDVREKQPVVVLVGHIDHGKSSILEKIKDLRVLEKESGGITQHISAYEIEKGGKKLTFIDTPGHAAFIEMRARGTKIADLAVLVVAADEGVEAQTKEAIKHLQESNTPFVVALNKVDKAGANSAKIKGQLAEEGVVVEEKKGEIPAVETSAQTGKGIEELVEVILLLAEVQEFEADWSDPAEGVVIESHLSSKRGPIAVLLVKKGVLRTGSVIATSSSFGRIKKMEDFKGEKAEKAEPGQPVAILGFNQLPRVGQRFRACSCLDEARQAAEEAEECRVGAEDDKSGEVKTEKRLNLIIKVDVVGSIDPVKRVLSELPQDKIGVNIIKSDMGDVGLNDVHMADTCEAVIIGFRVGVPNKIKREAEKAGVPVYLFDVIYKLKEGVEKIMKGSLGFQKVRVNLAKLKTLAVFKTDSSRQVVGVKVEKGEVKRGNKIEVFRPEEGEVELKSGAGIGEGKVVNVQRNKKDIKSGKEGEEVGLLYESRGEKVKEGDILVAYEIREKKMELS